MRPVSFHQPRTTLDRTSFPLDTRYWMASVISSSPLADGSMRLYGLFDRVVEQVDAHQGQVGGRGLGLLHQPNDMSRIIELSYTEG